MNLYDNAHQLARAIRSSEEMKSLVEAKSALATDTTAQDMVRDFMTKQMELEYAHMMGREVDEQAAKAFRELTVRIANNSLASRYLEAFGRWQRIAADVQKIVAEAMQEGMPDMSGAQESGQ